MKGSRLGAATEPRPRRRLLLWLGSLSLLAAVGKIGQGVWRFMTPPLTHPQPSPVAAGPPAAHAAQTLTYIAQATAWLGRDAGGFYALSAVCTHLGCILHEDASGFACPCHGSLFAADGTVLHGPATQPLNYLAVTLKEGQLMVDPARFVSPATRLAVSL